MIKFHIGYSVILIQNGKKINNIEFICNPRGRPEDYDREIYNLKNLEFTNL